MTFDEPGDDARTSEPSNKPDGRRNSVAKRSQASARSIAMHKARALRNEHRKKDRRNRYLLKGGIAAGLVAIVAIIIVVLVAGIRPPSVGPKNMLSDGIKIGQGFKAVPTAALAPDSEPASSSANPADVIDIQIYLDYQCQLCGDFESTNAAQISTYLKTGAATIEIHPIAILDNLSLGTKYSTRAANAAGCVANYSPNSFFAFSALLFDKEPKENTEGLTDAQLGSLAKKAKAENLTNITKCISDEKFVTWVSAATTRATSGKIANSSVAKIVTAPTIIINGTQYTGALNDSRAFAAAVVKAAGESYAKVASPSPSPRLAP